MSYPAARNVQRAGNIIRLINSDFKQIILHYNTDKDLTSTIEEYVLSEDDKPIRRRRYDCTCDKEATEIFDSNDSVFSIVKTVIDNLFKNEIITHS